MRLVLINHNIRKAVASIDLSTNTLRLKDGKEVVVGRNTSLVGEVGISWFAMMEVLNYGSIGFMNGDNFIASPTKEQLLDWMPTLAIKAVPKGAVYLQQNEEFICHSVWQMK
jgi:hypothetical protein